MLFRKKSEATSLIDLHVAPFQPEGWTTNTHFFRPESWFTKICLFKYLNFDPSKVFCFVSEKQEAGNSVEGIYLIEMLTRRFLLNANVLDHLLKHQELIPKDWFGYSIVFLGTTYTNADGKQFARYLYNDGHQWLEDSLCLKGVNRFSYKHKVPYIGLYSMLKLIRI